MSNSTDKIIRVESLWIISGDIHVRLINLCMFASEVYCSLSKFDLMFCNMKIYQIIDNDQTVYVTQTVDQATVTLDVPTQLTIALLKSN